MPKELGALASLQILNLSQNGASEWLDGVCILRVGGIHLIPGGSATPFRGGIVNSIPKGGDIV